MSSFPKLADAPLWSLFRDFDAAEPLSSIAEDDLPEWYAKLAMQIAKSGKHGLDFLLSHLTTADAVRLRAILISLNLLNRRLVQHPHTRSRIKQGLLTLLGHHDPLVKADVVDALRLLGFAEALEPVWQLRHDPSPYIGGSILRFLSK